MKTKIYFLALLPVAFVGFVLRIFQLLNGIEPDTAFFRENEPINTVFLVWIAAATLFFLSAAVLTKPEKKSLGRALLRIHGAEKTVLLLFGVVILAEVLFLYYDKVLAQHASSFQEMVLNLDFLRSVVAVLSVAFLSAFISAPKQFGKATCFKVLSLALTLHYGLQMLDLFINESMIRLSYKALDVLLYTSAMLFFFSFTKALSGLYARRGLCTFGCCTVFFAVVRMANLVVVLIHPSYTLSTSILSMVADLFLIVVVALLMTKPLQRRKKKPKDLAEETLAEETLAF